MNTESAVTDRRSRTALIWVGLIAPLGILLLATLVMIAWLPQMPDPSAVHWSGDGPDGFAAPWVNVVVPIAVGGGIAVLFSAIALSSHRRSGSPGSPGNSGSSGGSDAGGPRSVSIPAPTSRLLGAVSLGVAVQMAVVGLASTGLQRGLADAASAPEIGGWVLVGFGLLIAFTVLGWFLQPTPPRRAAWQPPAAEPLALPAGARAAWFGTSALSRSAVIVLSLTLFIVLALGAVLVALGIGGGWIAVGVGALMVIAVLSTSVFHVRVDASGLHVRSALGFPRFAVPAQQIRSVRAIDVDPVADFGGWGIRWGGEGRFGIVLRRGRALEALRENGRSMVVTLDDADTAAAVLSTAAF